MVIKKPCVGNDFKRFEMVKKLLNKMNIQQLYRRVDFFQIFGILFSN